MTSARRSVRRLIDGRAMLNLGSGRHIAEGWNNVCACAVAWRARHPILLWLARVLGIVSAEHYELTRRIGPKITYWDLRKGIPFDDGVFDVVYHSHFLEHLSREDGVRSIEECYRVLKPGGVIRAVVPDLEGMLRDYQGAIKKMERGTNYAQSGHQAVMAVMLGSMVCATWYTELADDGKQAKKRDKPKLPKRVALALARRKPENSVDIHRWMYDRYSLEFLLSKAGFRNIVVHRADTSSIEGWVGFGLDRTATGEERHRCSLYMEGARLV